MLNFNRRFIADIYSGVVELALPLLLLILIVGTIGFLIARLGEKTKVRRDLPFLLAFAFLGGVPGVIAGASQEPIIGAMLTGLLGVISALLSYMFSKEALSEWRPIIPYAIIFMVISALGGLTIGSVRKAKFDNFDREYAVYKSELENLYFPVEKEIRLMRARQALGIAQIH
jgi:hypothetical protein